MTPHILFFVFILGSLVQAEEKVQTDSRKDSDLEFAKLLEKKFRNDFLVSFENHQYAVTDLLAHQPRLGQTRMRRPLLPSLNQQWNKH